MSNDTKRPEDSMPSDDIVQPVKSTTKLNLSREVVSVGVRSGVRGGRPCQSTATTKGRSCGVCNFP